MGSRFAFAAVAVACVAAAGAGSYLATRHNLVSTTAPAASAAVLPPPAADPQPDAAASAPALPAATATASAAPDVPEARPEPRRTGKPGKPQEPASAAAPAGGGNTRHNSLEGTAPRAHGPEQIASLEPPTHPPVPDPLPSTPTDAHSFDAPRAPDPPPTRTFEDLVVDAESVIGLQMESTVRSDRARVEDRVEARVSRDVQVGGEVAIPAGTRAIGSVEVVERGGRMRERARLGIRFHTLELADGTIVPISTRSIYRLGESPSNGSAAKIGGGAVAGAILGAIIGGGKGAAIGAGSGAGAGTAAVMASEPRPAIFPAGTDVTARIVAPVTITVERE